MDYEKYLYIKYRHAGRGWEAGDCFNLLQLLYAEEFAIRIPDTGTYPEDWWRTSDLMLEQIGSMGFTPIVASAPGDLVLFSRRGRVCHCGVLLDSEYFLHTTKKGTAVHSLYALFGGLRPHGYYRHKERTDAD